MKIVLNDKQFDCELLDEPNVFAFSVEKAVDRQTLEASRSGLKVLDGDDVVFDMGAFDIQSYSEDTDRNLIQVVPASNMELKALESKVAMLEMQILLNKMNTDAPTLPLPEV